MALTKHLLDADMNNAKHSYMILSYEELYSSSMQK